MSSEVSSGNDKSGGGEEHSSGSDDRDRGISEEEWMELMNRADPLEQRLRTQKEFNRLDPPAQSIKAYQQETQYYLLNRGQTPVKRLHYRAYETDVNVHRIKSSQLYEVQDFPPESFFQAGRMDLEGQRRMAFTLVLAEWGDGHVFEAEAESSGHRLRLFDPADPVSSPDDLGLSVAPVEPTPVNR